MAFFGHFQNKKYALHQFYLKKINDKEQADKEQQQRDEQKRKQEAKIADANSRSQSVSQYWAEKVPMMSLTHFWLQDTPRRYE